MKHDQEDGPMIEGERDGHAEAPDAVHGLTADQTVRESCPEMVANPGGEDTDSPAIDEVEDGLSEESSEEGAESDAAPQSSDEAQPTDPAAQVVTANDTSKDGEDNDGRCELEKQPYDYDKCTIQVAIQLLPDAGGEGGRTVIVGVRSHLDSPIVRVVKWNELGALPAVVNDLLDELKRDLPNREHSAREAYERKKLEKNKRKAQVNAASARSGQRAKKAAKPTGLSDAPTASASASESRPRPDVTVPTSGQRQIGLF